MKKLNLFACVFCCMILFFSSCSKDDPEIVEGKDATATLSFGAVLNDLINKDGIKQAVTLPECSDELPAYVAVVLSGQTAVGTMQNPVRVNLTSHAGEYFTVESSDLELTPGEYSLDFFAVYDSNHTLIWLAPSEDGVFGEWVNTLPMEFELGAGVKKYLDVDVICFDDRQVNLYGYLFFDLVPTEAIEFCLFGNVCDDTGRHAPANFRFDVWTYSGNPANPRGNQLFDEEDPFINNVGINADGEAFAEPLCIFLPDSQGEDIYHGELYLIENGTSTLIRSGQFTDADVNNLFNGDDAVNYYHFREGNCNMGDSPNLFSEPGGQPPVISADTNIYIYFDSSGSMNSTLSPLNTMRDRLLKDALISLYNNDDDLYDQKVRVISESSERTFDFLNVQGETPAGDVIVLAFQDEAVSIYHPSHPAWDENSARSSTFEADIATLRTRLASFPNNYYHAVIFQVQTSTAAQYANFGKLITYVENGTGNYSGNYGLADRDEIGYVYGVTPGAAPAYYQNLIVDALEGLGYQL